MKEQTFLAAASRKKEYDAPMVELIEARVEKGFASSGENGGKSAQLENYGKGSTNALFT